MKKVTVFIGTETKRNTYRIVQEFEKNLKKLGEVDFEYVYLHDYNLQFCRSCCSCFLKGEEYCPLKDDRDKLIEKMENSDGVVWATPNYVMQVSGRMKNFLDHLAFIYHRPRFFGKAATALVSQGVFGGRAILKYLYSSSKFMGFHVSKGCCVTTLAPMTKRQEEKLKKEAEKAAIRFHRELNRETPAPNFFRLLLFRTARTSIKNSLGPDFRDYRYYKEKGWFESDYYHPTSLGPVKKLAGKLFDFLGKQMAKRQ